MKKLMLAAVYLFAILGVLVTGGVGYVYATNGELMDQFWAVKDDLKAIPAERRTEVVAELPERITFEKEVREDLGVLPAERQSALYEQLAKSRDQVFEQFKKRIKAEADIARAAQKEQKGAAEVSKEIEKQLGKVDVGVSLGGQPKAPAANNLSEVDSALDNLSVAREAHAAAHDTSDKQKRVNGAIGVMEALDKLGDKIVAARKKSLTEAEKSRLSTVVRDAKNTLFDTRQTPGLVDHPKYKGLNESIGKKLNQ